VSGKRIMGSRWASFIFAAVAVDTRYASSNFVAVAVDTRQQRCFLAISDSACLLADTLILLRFKPLLPSLWRPAASDRGHIDRVIGKLSG